MKALYSLHMKVLNFKNTKLPFLKFLVFLLLILLPCSSIAQNVAFNKKYKLSIKPNYELTLIGDYTDLTDGKKKNGSRFWQDISTVGWRGVSEVEIDVDLNDKYLLKHFSINTARNSSAEVEFPLNCFVFVSNDNENFSYQGNIMMSPSNISGGYKVKEFFLEIEPIQAKYVKFVLVSNSKFMFLDEIEIHGVLSGEHIDSKTTDIMHKTAIKDYTEKLRLERSEEIDNKYQEELLRKYLSIKQNDKSLNELIHLKKVTQLDALANEVVYIPINSLAELNNFTLKDAVKFHKKNNAEELIDIDSSLFFTLINNQEESIEVNFDYSEGSLYEVLRVSNHKSVSLYDALKPINDKIKMEEGEYKMFVLSFNRSSINSILKISSKEKLIKKLEVKSYFLIGDIPDDYKLNVNVWSYLDKPIIKENKKYVVNDLESTGVNTIVIHQGFIDEYDTDDFKKLKNYLKNFTNLPDKKILLFNNLKNREPKKFGGKKFLDIDYKKNFASWYNLLLEELANIGVKKDNVYFYPYDEISKEEVLNFITLNNWAKQTIEGYQSFVTILDESVIDAANSATLVQASRFMLNDVSKINHDNLWFYDVLDSSRDRSPLKDYRAMAWEAYYYDLKGIGFWNYSALKNTQSALYNVPINNMEDYSVLYIDENSNVLSSVRWLYFAKGIEDYKLLKNAEEKLGKNRVKKLVKRFLDNPTEEELIDVLKQL